MQDNPRDQGPPGRESTGVHCKGQDPRCKRDTNEQLATPLELANARERRAGI